MNGIYLIINHHFDFTEDELIGIRSQLRALKYMDLCLVTYSQNQLDKFIDIFKEDISQLAIDQNKIIVEYFDHKYFESIQGYNNLLCSTEFYDRFKKYDFIVVSQPDVYLIATDKLLDLPLIMSQYDYLGAPWVLNTFHTFSLKKIRKYFFAKAFLNTIQWYVLRLFNFSLVKNILHIDSVYFSGNGGFSVRNPKVMISYLESLNEKDYLAIKVIRESADTSLDQCIYAEDVFWTFFPVLLKKKIKLAPSSVAIKYAWEHGSLKNLLFYSNGDFPLAVHAWMKISLKKFVLNYDKGNLS
jgi:hypothetical protein